MNTGLNRWWTWCAFVGLYCVRTIVPPADAYNVSLRATPEMEAAGKEPGRNLADKLLNEPGVPTRTCRFPPLRPGKTFFRGSVEPYHGPVIRKCSPRTPR